MTTDPVLRIEYPPMNNEEHVESHLALVEAIEDINKQISRGGKLSWTIGWERPHSNRWHKWQGEFGRG